MQIECKIALFMVKDQGKYLDDHWASLLWYNYLPIVELCNYLMCN